MLRNKDIRTSSTGSTVHILRNLLRDLQSQLALDPHWFQIFSISAECRLTLIGQKKLRIWPGSIRIHSPNSAARLSVPDGNGPTPEHVAKFFSMSTERVVVFMSRETRDTPDLIRIHAHIPRVLPHDYLSQKKLVSHSRQSLTISISAEFVPMLIGQKL
jgi:hypothetical protein